MLERDRKLLRPAEIIRGEITLAPGETEQARFKAWRAEKLAAPRFCAKHPSTQLVYTNSEESGIWTALDEARHPLDKPKVLPGIFIFYAALRCPVCRCAYALCPPEFHATSFKTFTTSTAERTNALAVCREFAAQVNKNNRGFALFVGVPGTGKTRLACNIVRVLENADALYVRQGQLTTAIRSTYGRKDVFLHRPNRRDDDDDAGDDEPPTPLEIVQAVRFLVLDEIGCAPLANDERLLLDEMLKHRYDHGKPTILISNLPLDELKSFLGDALSDRISHATIGGKFILQFSGESFRRGAGVNYLNVSA